MNIYRRNGAVSYKAALEAAKAIVLAINREGRY